MNILHVISGLAKIHGGTSEVVPRLCEALHAHGENVRVLTCEYGELSAAAIRAKKSGVDVRVYNRTGVMGKMLRYSAQMQEEIDKHVRWADVVHLHGLWQWPCWAAGWAAWRNKKPYVMMPHGFLEPERLKISSVKKKIVGIVCERQLLNRANGIVATSESELDGIRQYGIDRPAHIMPIGLDVNFYKCGKHGGQKAENKALFFSRITPVKGLDMLADAWGRLQRDGAGAGWRLLIVGPDDRGYTDVIKKVFAEKCPVGTYEFRAPVYGEDKYRLLSSVDALVLPTRSENWSIAVAEAMASGIPVVCTKGAPWKCLETEHAGWWVDVSVDGVECGIRELIKLNDSQRQQMGCNGRCWVEENLDWRHIAQEMTNFYEKILSC